MTREQLRHYYLGDELYDLRNAVAMVHRYTRRCTRCGTWLEESTVGHGSLGGSLFCNGVPARRRRVTVVILPGPNFSPFRWRAATPEERRQVLALAKNAAQQRAHHKEN